MAHVGEEFTFGTAARFGSVLGSSQGLLGSLALGDVQERHNRAHNFALFADRVGPIFDVKAGTVSAPKNFLIGVNTLADAERGGHSAILFRISGPVGMGMVNDVV